MFKKLDAWLEKKLFIPGDDAEKLALKKRFWLFMAPSPIVMWVIGIILWMFQMPILGISMLIFGVIELILLGMFTLIPRQVQRFALIHQYFYVFVSFIGTLYFGGILNSCGIVFVGLAGALQAIFFLSPKQIQYIFGVYILTLIIETLCQPLLTPLPEITPTVNLILFVAHFIVIANVLYSILSNFVNQSLRIKEKETERLRELDAIKTRFYTDITHEFRTPLTVILGMANQIKEKPKKYFSQGIPLIRRSGIRLLHLVNQMMDLSKLEAGSMPLHLIQSDILPYLHQVVESFQHLAEDKNIHLHFLSDLDKISMDFDPEKMDSLFGNLLHNAIKYSDPNSDIFFMVSREYGEIIMPESSFCPFGQHEITGILHAPKKLRIVVKDSGYGIEKDQLPRIFDRFYQGSKDQISRKEGSGIGLVIVKELVKLLEGTLFVQSSPGKGTEFSIYLPITNEAIKDVPELPVLTNDELFTHDVEFTEKWMPQANLSNLLIIEDNPDVVTYIRSIVEPEYHIDIAKNGEEGIEKALEIIPDIILSDVMMPGKSGFEVCKTLKVDFRTSHIPIVLLTAKADKDAQITGYEYGADAYLTKPFNSRELLVRLKKLIEIREKLKTKYRATALNVNQRLDPSNNPEDLFLHKIKSTLDDHFGNEDFDSNQLSHELGMSRVQLFRKLKTLTGVSASHYIRSYRLFKAKTLIQTTSLNISEISYEVGFKDPAYFSRAFAKEFGFAPTALRQKAP